MPDDIEMRKAKFSERDSRGMISVDCTECNRGKNGSNECAAGKKIKKGHQGSCFNGGLIDGLEI